MTTASIRLVLAAGALCVVAALPGPPTEVQAQTGCAALANPIPCENAKAGAPASEWDVSGAGDSSIQGFATDISVVRGQTQRFKVTTTASLFRIDIYRLGYYGGMGARLVASILNIPRVAQPSCLTQSSTGLVDCGNWSVSASWVVPSDAVSGIYLARLVRPDTGGASHAIFVVRDDTGRSDLLFQTSDTTWQAYNRYGGNSLYVGSPAGRAYKVSYNRPFDTRAHSPADWVFNAEYPMLRFLEANGYNVSYFTGVDSHRLGAELLEHKVVLSTGHDEYWSGAQRAAFESARAAGVSLAFFSGNSVFWKTRWEASIDGSNTPHRTLVCYKETHANAKIDPSAEWTGTWRDPRFSPPSDGGRPENSLMGTLFLVNDGNTTAIEVPAAFGKTRFWRNTSVANLAPGGVATLAAETLGYEWDGDLNNGFRPSGLIELSSTTKNVNGMLLDYGSTYGPGTVTHKLTLYRHPSGALVFAAGTVQWAWGLDAEHDRGGPSTPDVRMQQATVNLFADMGAQPDTLQPGLVPASPSLDSAAPTSTITAPTSGQSFAAGSMVAIRGTAAENGGGVVAGVEVSMDGGTTWYLATGTTSWSFNWTAAGSGPVTITSRAYDDSGNFEIPSGGVPITVTSTNQCPCTMWDPAARPPQEDDNDPAAVELGTKFRSDVNGYITGVRFYKAPLNTGTHTGSLWTRTGTLLARATFTNETASGWQQVSFDSPVAIAANTTYVVSYHAPNGHYTGTNDFFKSSLDRPPLHGLLDGADGPNGVYKYGASGFPTNTYQSEAYWVDVVFVENVAPDTTPPTVTSTSPANGQSGVSAATTVAAVFSEAMDGTTIFAAGAGGAPGTFELRLPGGQNVAATVTYDAATRTATLQPSSTLALSTTYTAVVRGGTVDPRARDQAGNALAADITWTFTTSSTPPPPPAPCPCSIWAPNTTPPSGAANDPSAVELGTRFRSDVAGWVTGVRFYKAPTNTGTHVGNLWSNGGSLLGTVTFANETASGWQQADFASPIAIQANTSYIVSYHAPNGNYTGTVSQFASAGVDNPPLHALRDGVDGANGVYRYGSTGFPSNTWNSQGYWVDLVFVTSLAPDTTPPVVLGVTPAPDASGVKTNTNVTVTFNESMTASTINGGTFELRTPTNTLVAAAVTYDAATRTATLTPSAPLQLLTRYTATVRGGSADPRVKDTAGNALAANYVWSFTTAAPPPPPPTEGRGGPVLVVSSSANPFSAYYAEILRNEGFSAFTRLDLSQVNATVLAGYDAVILGEMPLTASQVSMFGDWVTAGGHLVAMRPDKQLAGLLGLTDAGATLANVYLLIDTASAPGAGLTAQTMQFHGIADRYVLNGATALATLYSTATTATSHPAVTRRTVGAGTAVAFTFDLARSVVYTRQGNPAWPGQERDGFPPIRSDDLFYGARAGDVQPDWVDLSKVAIPQADEQQRLLWNILLNATSSRRPLPRFWYFPRMLKAVVVMTGDDHANNGTEGRFNTYIAASPAGCSVDDWQCIRGTSYIYPNTPLTPDRAAAFEAAGFEIAVHVNTNCADYTPSSLRSFYTTQIADFRARYPGVPAPTTNRTHCIAFSDYDTQPQVELENGIRFDTNYYYWPGSWVQDRPGMFTGSGMPMRFATLSGQMIDVYQAATQITDESNQTYQTHITALLDRALGADGYYVAVTANMHTDYNPSPGATGSEIIVAAAQQRGVPVVTARQMLQWLDARNGSYFQNITYSSNRLQFSIAVAAGATGLHAMVPASAGGQSITGITVDGSAVSYTTQTIKGVPYAVFAARSGAYQVSYGGDIIPPVISDLSASPASTTASITWTTNEASNSRVTYGTSPSALSQSATNAPLVTSHNVTLTNLATGTTYYYRAASADAAGNSATSPAEPNAPASFTTAMPLVSIGDVSVTEGHSGTTVAAFPVTLSFAATQTATVQFATSNGTATAGTDYTATSGTLTFNPGETVKTINVTVMGDTANEPDETFSLLLSNPSQVQIADGLGIGTILNDDAPGASALSINDASVVEGHSGLVNITFSVTLSPASSQTVTVNFATANGTAVAGQDYAQATGTLTFSPGVTTQPVVISVFGDTLDEADETFLVNLSAPANATLADGQGIGTIQDDDPLPSLTIADRSVAEGNSGSTNAAVVVTLSPASGRTVTVAYATANRTATAGSDYTAVNGTLTFAPGVTSQSIAVPILGDTIDEPDETFEVNLSGPVNAVLADAQAIVTITDDDPPAGPAGLVAAYGFGAGSGSTVTDASGNGNHGTISGATWSTQGRNGNALSFDGVNDSVAIPHAASLGVTRVTVMAWVRPTTLSGWRTAVLKETSNGLAYALYAHDSAPRPAGYVNTGSGDRSAEGASAIALNAWTHLATTYDGANIRLYVNGTLVRTRAVTGNIVSSTQPLRIGGNAIWGEWFAGLIDDVRVYNRALTQSEIQSGMNTPVP